MQRLTGFWRSITGLEGGKLIAVWAKEMGAEFGTGRQFLKATTRRSSEHPCRQEPPCGCWHEVAQWSDGRWMAGCRCEAEDHTGCGAFEVQPGELMIHALDREKVAEEIRRALGLEATAAGDAGGAWAVGRHPRGRWPAYLCAPWNEAGMVDTVNRLGASTSAPALVLVPWEGMVKPGLTGILARQGMVIVPLEPLLAPGEGGGFIAAPGTGARLAEVEKELGARHGTEAVLREIRKEIGAVRQEYGRMRGQLAEVVDEDVARQAFALVKALDGEEKTREAPVFTVFRLYCMEGMSAQAVAARCGCSKATIINRLRRIEERTGASPEKLRGYSAQFEAMEESLSDPRARRIYRKGAIEGDGEEEEG